MPKTVALLYLVISMGISPNLCQGQVIDSIGFGDFWEPDSAFLGDSFDFEDFRRSDGTYVEGTTIVEIFYYEAYIENVNEIAAEFFAFFTKHPDIKSISTDLFIKPKGKVIFPEGNAINIEPYNKGLLDTETKKEIGQLIEQMNIYFIEEIGYEDPQNHIYIKNDPDKLEIILNGYDDYSFPKD